eukprot:scaffold75140_cov19-Tisochrysis_lutea.AAC.1
MVAMLRAWRTASTTPSFTSAPTFPLSTNISCMLHTGTETNACMLEHSPACAGKYALLAVAAALNQTFAE